MNFLIVLIKIIVGLSVLNVWLIRANKPTRWRGANAANLTEEFAYYGISRGFMKMIGNIKIILAILLILSIWINWLENFAALGISIMMLAAVGMHLKVKDPFIRALPSFTFSILSLILVIF